MTVQIQEIFLESFFGALRTVQPGEQVKVTYRRGAETRTTTITVGSVER